MLALRDMDFSAVDYGGTLPLGPDTRLALFSTATEAPNQCVLIHLAAGLAWIRGGQGEHTLSYANAKFQAATVRMWEVCADFSAQHRRNAPYPPKTN